LWFDGGTSSYLKNGAQTTNLPLGDLFKQMMDKKNKQQQKKKSSP
jgi:hypothetical protein